MSSSQIKLDESSFKQLFELSPDPTWTIEDNQFVACNEAALKALGYRHREEILNSHPSKLSPPMQPDGEDSYAKAERLMAIAESRGLHRFEWVHTKADGTNFLAEVTLAAIVLKNRKVLYCTWRDITERKQAEVTRDQLAAIVEYSTDAIYSRKIDGAIVSWNPGAEKMLGYTADEVIGKSGDMIIPPSRRGSVRGQINERILRGETIPARESDRLTRDGRVIDVMVTNSPIKDDNGRIVGVSVILRDITEIKRAQKALRESEEQFRSLVEQSIAGIYIIQDGKLAYANPRAAEIVGQGSVDDLIGTDPLVWVAEADRGKVGEVIRQLSEGEVRSAAMDFEIRRRDGVKIQVGAHATLATREGQPAIIGLIQDISEKKRAEEQDRRYLQQLKTAFLSTVEVATTLSAMRDPYTGGHERRVGKIAASIGIELGLDEQRVEGLRVAGNLHDIGKITIPAEILSKPGKLSEIEFQLIQGHPQSGYDVLKDVEFPWPVAQVALQHHERMDGSGYPQGLRGEAIVLEARIMAVADVVEAMSSHRPYRPGLGIEKALAEIERGRGTAYEAEVADACLRLFREKRYQLPE